MRTSPPHAWPRSLLLNASYHLDGPIHIRWGTTTSRETLQIAGHVAAAIDHNTDLPSIKLTNIIPSRGHAPRCA